MVQGSQPAGRPQAWSPGAVGLGLGGTAALIGCLVLAGWTGGIPFLKSVSPSWVAMQPLTAVGMILSGAALIAGLQQRHRLQSALISLVAVGAGSTVAEYLFGIDLPWLDRLLYSRQVSLQPLPFPGRVSGLAAVEFLLLAAALALLRRPAAARLSTGIALLGLLIALASLSASLFGIDRGSRLGACLSMAAQSHLGFVCLFLAAWLAQSRQNWLADIFSAEGGATVPRRLVPMMVALPLAVGVTAEQMALSAAPPSALRMAAAMVVVVVVLGGFTLWLAHGLNRADRQARQAASQAAAATLQFRALADNIPQLAWMARADGWIFWYNQRWYEYTGTTLDQVQGWGWRSVHHPEHVERVHEKLQRAWDSGEPWEDTFPLRGRDGQYRWFLSRALPVRDGLGKVALWFGTNTDVTEQREQEAALTLAKEKAERANYDKSRFMAAASHDLRQPVQALLLFSTALGNMLDDKPASAVLHSMHAALKALQTLLDGLLDVSRLDAGVIVPTPRAFKVEEVTRQICQEYAIRAAERGLKFRCIHSGAVVRSDPALFERILRNLIENALRYTERGGILIGCRRRGDELLIQVIDTGIGIPPQEQELIFQEFYQIDNPERDGAKGLGLGLSIIRGLTHLLGHRLALSSRPGHGTTFGLALPLADDTLLPAALPTAGEEEKPERTGLVLIIDDEAIIRLGMVLLLEGWGWEVAAAADADGAVAWIEREGRCPDVVLADFRLREGHFGTDAIRRVQQACGCPVPGVIVTGDTSPERLTELTASGFLVAHKPLAPAALRRLVQLTWIGVEGVTKA